MKKIWQWLKDSKRLKHLLLGVGVGLGADDLYCAEYVGIGVCYIGGCKTDGTQFNLIMIDASLDLLIDYRGKNLVDD